MVAIGPSVQRDQIVGLDHLRAMAALMVFYWHGLRAVGIQPSEVPSFPPATLFEEGYIGVSLFIAITGFIFTVLTHGKEINYFGFLKNRFLRLFPLLFLVLIFAAQTGTATYDSVFLFFNLLGAGTPYVVWTLVIEFQFYLAFPFLRNSLIRPTMPSTLLRCAAFVLMFVVMRGTYFAIKGEVQSLGYYSIFGRADEFVAGIIAGVVYLRTRGDDRLSTKLMAIITLIICSAALVTIQHMFNLAGGFHGQPSYPSPSPLLIVWPTVNAVLWGGIIWSYCLLTRKSVGWLAKGIAYAGTISYSFYMLHVLTLQLWGKLYAALIGRTFLADPLSNAFLVVTVFFLPPTLLVAAISYELFEKPFLKQRVPYLTPRLA